MDIEKLARDFSQYKDEYEGSLYTKGLYEGYKKGFKDSVNLKVLDLKAEDKIFTAADMLEAAEYGYNFRATTSFPQHTFAQECINNTKQWIIAKFKVNVWTK